MSKSIIAVWVCVAVLFAVALIAGFGAASPAGAADPPASATAVAAAPVQPESCVTCHPEQGAKHQASYDQLYQDGGIQVSDLAYAFTPTDTTTITFKMTKDGAPFDARQADSLAIYFAPYTGKSFQFEPAADSLPLLGKLTYDGAGRSTSTLTGKAPDVSNTPGLIVLYGTDEVVGQLPARVRQGKYPFAALLKTGSGVNYVSAANNAGCEKCHTVPFLKHGYIYGEVNHDPATDFYTCKACHLDNGQGGHFEWQLSVNDPPLGAKFLAEGEAAKLPPDQEAQYAYKTSLMNDVHMSHSMEFPYPQSMSNCVTCHEGKLDTILADANFKVSTCKSCHPVTGAKALAANGKDVKYDTTPLALKTILPPAIHGSLDLNTVDCTSCHGEGKAAPAFRQIHTGYDKTIYTAKGVRYSDAISVTVDSAAFAGNKLDIKFHAAQSPDLGLNVAQITPTVLVALYGWDTKDYILGPHEKTIDDNGDGNIDANDQRDLEYVVGDKHPRMSTVSVAGGNWEVAADLSTWANLIANKTVKRVEIAVLPTLVGADGDMLALDAPSRTFDLAANAFADGFYSPIVKAQGGCENCHDALATTFHTPDRGGNVVVCRMCHITKSGASHLEMQSRSIDSFVHAIHSGEAFDIGTIDFTDPVASLHYKQHIEFPYPKHGISDCESCHVKGTYDVPDQSQSLPGLLSASAEVKGLDRKIGNVPAYVTGPASKACGGCHRATMINEDNAAELRSFNQHTQIGGYTVPAGDDPNETLGTVIDQMMAIFK
jgi:OmcA/MtrC family decaheme c-type cytochrome